MWSSGRRIQQKNLNGSLQHCFNLAVDYYAGEEEWGARWARKAVKLADILATSLDAGDGGLLLSVLTRKMAELGWEVRGGYTP